VSLFNLGDEPEESTQPAPSTQPASVDDTTKSPTPPAETKTGVDLDETQSLFDL
jgi:hypothetical protein